MSGVPTSFKGDDGYCRDERCQYRFWQSGSMPTHLRGADCPGRDDRLGVPPLGVPSGSDPFSDEVPYSMLVDAFMGAHDLTEQQVREVFREYRSECDLSPFVYDACDLLDSEFLNWFRWERLG